MSKFITSDGVNIHYKLKGEGKNIIFVHGWSSDSSGFDYYMEELSKNHKVLKYDLRGHGKSDCVNYGLTLRRYGQDLHELIEFLKLDDIVLVGWSMGALVTFSYIEQYGLDKLDSLFIIDMTPKLLNNKDWELGLYHGKYQIQDALSDLEMISSNWIKFCEKFIKNVLPYISDEELKVAVRNKSDNHRFTMSSMWLSMVKNDYRELIKHIDIPTYIIYGHKSTLYSKDTAKYLNDNIQNSKVYGIEEGTHYLVIEYPEKLISIFKDILQ